ncbi:hypothetical protein [Ferruginibacter sp.]
MRPVRLCYAVMLVCSLSSCEFHCSVGSSGSVNTKPVTSNDSSPVSGAVIKNDIELEANDVKLKEAYLYDDNDAVLTKNETGLGQKIHLALRTDTGWVKENGLSFIGASERISTSGGKVIVDAPDIFKDYETTGLPADKAVDITLSARITEAAGDDNNYLVQFRVWDKKGKGEIKGKYKFSLKK